MKGEVAFCRRPIYNLYVIQKSSGAEPAFIRYPQSLALGRPSEDDAAGNRPCKRLKLDTEELAAESDVVNLQKP